MRACAMMKRLVKTFACQTKNPNEFSNVIIIDGEKTFHCVYVHAIPRPLYDKLINFNCFLLISLICRWRT